MCLQCQLESIPIGRLRATYFDKAFFEKHFPQLRDRCSGRGYPEMGQGRFADKLSDEQWVAFNNAQRVHGNYVEQLPSTLLLLLVSGLGAPRVAVPMGALYIVGRALFGMGYRSNGPRGRMLGSRLHSIATVVLLGTSVWTVWTMTGGVAGISNFAKSFLSF